MRTRQRFPVWSLMKFDVTQEYDIDLHAIFGLDDNVRPGMQIINADIHIV